MKRVTSPIINLLFTPSLYPFTHHFKSTPACRRILAFLHQASRRVEEESRNVRVSVWWDFANCNLPAGTNVFKVTTHITAAIRANGIKGPIQITAFGDVLQLTRSNQEALSSTGITLTHIPQGGKNSSDRSLFIDLMYWVSQNPPPCHILLISGDKDFASVLHRLRMNNYNILLASLEPVPSVLCSAASIMWHWHALLRGENITGKHFNQPPDGSHFSWYGQFRVPLEDPFSAPQHHSPSLSTGVEVLLPSQPGEYSNHCTIPIETSDAWLDSKLQPVPMDVMKRIHHVLSLFPKGIRIHALRSELEKSNINFDSSLYGYKTFSHLLSSMPHILKVVRSHGKYFVHAVKPPGSPDSVQPISDLSTNDGGVSDLDLPTFHKPPPNKDVAADVTTAAQPTSSILDLTHPPPPEKEQVSGSKVGFSQMSPSLPDNKVADVSNTPLTSSFKEHDSVKLSSPDKMFADVTNAPLISVKEEESISKVGPSLKFWMNSTISKGKGSSVQVLNSSVKSPTVDLTCGAPYTPVEVMQDSGSKVGFFYKLWTYLTVSKKGINTSVNSPSPDKEDVDMIIAPSTPTVKGHYSDPKIIFSPKPLTNIPKDNCSPEKAFEFSAKHSLFNKSPSIDKKIADVSNGAPITSMVERKQTSSSKVTFFQKLRINLTVFKKSDSSEKGLNCSVISSSPDIWDTDIISAPSTPTVKGHDSDSKVMYPLKPWTNITKDNGSSEKRFNSSANSPSLDKGVANLTSFFSKFWTNWTVSKDNYSSEKPEDAFRIQVESLSTVHNSKSGKILEETVAPSTNPAHSAPCTSGADLSILVNKISSSSKELNDEYAVLLNLIMNWHEFWSGVGAPESVSGHSNIHISYKDMFYVKKTELFCKKSFWNDLKAFLETPKAAGIISQSRNRDQVGQALQNDGPRVLKSVEKRDLQRLVELLISEKKWLEECSTGPSNFKLVRPHEQKISSGLQSSNDLKPIPSEHYWQNDELKYPPNVFDDSYTMTKKHSSNRSRDAILSDCEILIADLMKETSAGFNMFHFKPLFRHRYDYGLDIQKLGYPSLSSLFMAMPGVRISGNNILSGVKFPKEERVNEADPVLDELEPVVRNEAVSSKLSQNFKEEQSDYDYSLPDDDEELFSGSDEFGSEGAKHVEKHELCDSVDESFPKDVKGNLKVLADRFVKEGAQDLWNPDDGSIGSAPRVPSSKSKFEAPGRGRRWQRCRKYSFLSDP